MSAQGVDERMINVHYYYITSQDEVINNAENETTTNKQWVISIRCLHSLQTGFSCQLNIIIIIMEICKAHTRRLKALNKLNETHRLHPVSSLVFYAQSTKF